MHRKIDQLKDRYHPDRGDRCIGKDGQYIDVSWADRTLLEIIEAQRKQIAALAKQVATIQKRLPCTDEPSSELLEIASVQPKGTGILIARVKKARELFSFGLIDAKRYVERHFENGGRGALIE